MERVNFESMTRKIYSAALPFPLSYLVRSRLQADVAQQLSATNCATAASAYRVANDVCGALATLLDCQSYLGGERPCSLDATAFAWLAVAYYAPTPDTALRDAVKANSNLVRYVERILAQHFAAAPKLGKRRWRRRTMTMMIMMTTLNRLVAPEHPLDAIKYDAFAAAWDAVVPLRPNLDIS